MNLKSALFTLVKLAIATALVYWMVASGKLHFGDLRILIDQPKLLVICVLQWTLVAGILCPLRWLALLRGLYLPVSAGRAVQLTLVGLFFNSVMPGAVGGDIIKAAYVIRDQQSRKTPAMMTIVLDRVVGMMGLFAIGTVAILMNLSHLWAMLALRPMIVFIFGSMLALIFLYVAALIPISDSRDPLLKILSFQLSGGAFFAKIFNTGLGLCQKIYVALRSYRARPSALFIAFFIAVLNQLITMFFFIYMTTALTHQEVHLGEFASVFPIGSLTTALPLAPGGLGIGHVVFDKLYEMIHLKGGSDVFNIYFLTSICMSLVGVVPYLMLGKNPATIQTAGTLRQGEAVQ